MKGLEKFEPGCYYHVVNHAVGNENLFRSKENYRYFLEKYYWYMAPVSSTLCYCLMPNHIHFLIKTFDEKKLSSHVKFKGDFHKLIMQQLSNLLNAYAKAYNKSYCRRGALWIDFTKRFKIGEDGYLSTVISYIHRNPVKHGFTKRIEDWDHSSYSRLISQEPSFLSKREVFDWFGGIEGFLDFHSHVEIPMNDQWEYF